jgi:tetratricopeptide (TPR) repeat protein
MTFAIPKVTADDATVDIKWTNVAVPFTIGTGTTQKVLAEARAAVAAAKPDDWQTPLRAANFAVENRVDLEEANRWLDQSIKINENIRNLFEKARAQAAMGDRDAAIKTAQRAIEKAGPKDKDEVGEIEHSIASWKS